MECLRPFRHPKYGTLPCGRCLNCKINRSENWVMRLEHEKRYWNKSVFITLTYNNDNVGVSLIKKDLQDFIKRLRKNIEPENIMYYACGEYGDNTKRPHYHMIIFGLSKNDYDIILLSWKKGFITVGVCNESTIRYTAKYIQKKLLGKDQTVAYKKAGLIPPFAIMSKKMGLKWLLDNKDKVIKDYGIRVRDKILPIPRYYLNKLVELNFISKDMILEKSILNIIERQNEWWRISEDSVAFSEARRTIRNQKYLDLLKKMEIYENKRKRSL